MRLTEQSRYALRVLAHCAERHPALAKVATIAAVTGITEQNIFKLKLFLPTPDSFTKR